MLLKKKLETLIETIDRNLKVLEDQKEDLKKRYDTLSPRDIEWYGMTQGEILGLNRIRINLMKLLVEYYGDSLEISYYKKGK